MEPPKPGIGFPIPRGRAPPLPQTRGYDSGGRACPARRDNVCCPNVYLHPRLQSVLSFVNNGSRGRDPSPEAASRQNPTGPQRLTVFIRSAVYLSPVTLISLKRAFVSFRSAAVSGTASAPMLSSKYLSRLVPGIGIISFP
jgi:hypothetical protein